VNLALPSLQVVQQSNVVFGGKERDVIQIPVLHRIITPTVSANIYHSNLRGATLLATQFV
jgi:hypothetical protein